MTYIIIRVIMFAIRIRIYLIILNGIGISLFMNPSIKFACYTPRTIMFMLDQNIDLIKSFIIQSQIIVMKNMQNNFKGKLNNWAVISRVFVYQKCVNLSMTLNLIKSTLESVIVV